jgi:hypothetical protein
VVVKSAYALASEDSELSASLHDSNWL